MRNRILTLANLLMIAVCGYCVWYLATQDYEERASFAQARSLLDGIETTNGSATIILDNETGIPGREALPPPVIVENPTPNTALFSKQLTAPIYTPTPSPTPTPTPTPAPPDLATAVLNWAISSIDGDKVEFVDKRDPNMETFVLTVGGPPRETVDKDQQPIPISLISVDLDNNVAILGYQDQRARKPMFE